MPENTKSRLQREASEQQKAMREMGPYMTLGIQLVLTILVFFGIGYWLDGHFQSGSLWRTICTGFGAFASLVYFIVTVLRLSKNEETKAR
jgi:F0F1-type ATP synthase assembly protein I